MVDADNVLDEFKKDRPMISKIYAKSDNAGCYHGNYVLEALYKICTKKGITLLQYDYNQSCKGKDQCGRKSDGAKAGISSFVNSGHDLKDANDVFNALHYGKGIKNMNGCVLEVDLQESALQGSEIKDIRAFHSSQFFPSNMKLYKYFNIGTGFKVQYSCLRKEYSHTQKYTSNKSSSKQRRRELTMNCANYFFAKIRYVVMFSNLKRNTIGISCL